MHFYSLRLSISQVDEHLAVCPEAEQDCPFKNYGCAVKVWSDCVCLPSAVLFICRVHFTLIPFRMQDIQCL